MENLKVEYNHLGRSGLKVSNLCLGTMTFGTFKGDPFKFFDNPKQLDLEGSCSILNRFVEAGGNFIDTADLYSYGNSEEILGQWLSTQKRDKLVIATKCRFPLDSTDPNSVGLSRKHILQSVEESLARLKTDYIDLYQIHCWDKGTPLEETLRALDDLVRIGKVRYVGASNVTGWQLQKIACYTKFMGLTPFISLQQQYNLLTRTSELEEFQVCKNEGIGVIPYSPLKSGLLTGKYKRGEKPKAEQGRVGFMKGTSIDFWPKYGEDEKFWKLHETLASIAKKHSKSVPQVSIRWLLQKEIVPSVIIGVTSMKQLEDNLGAAKGWELTKEEMNDLNTASSYVKGYPYDSIEYTNSTRNNSFLHDS